MSTSEEDRRTARTVMGLYALSFGLATVVAGYALLTMFEFETLSVPGYVPAAHEGVLRLVLDPWQHWDGQWYLRIAEHGYYKHDASAAFLPAYPWVVRMLSPLAAGDFLASACVVSWVAFGLALLALARLLRRDFEEGDTMTALLLLVTFPTAFFFHAAYTESLFLLLTVLAFSASRQGRWGVAGLAALGATLTRWTGFGLVPALAVEAWVQAASTRAEFEGRPVRLAELLSPAGRQSLAKIRPVAMGAAILPALALPIVLDVLQHAIGDPWGFSRAQRLWERRLAPPWVGLIDGVRVLLPGHPPYLEPFPGGFPRLPEYGGGFLEAHAYNLLAALGGLALSVVALRRLRPSYGVWALAGVVVPLMTPSRLQPLQSMPRFLVVLFPLFIASALLLRGRPLVTSSVVAVGAALQGFFIARFALWFWVA